MQPTAVYLSDTRWVLTRGEDGAYYAQQGNHWVKVKVVFQDDAHHIEFYQPNDAFYIIVGDGAACALVHNAELYHATGDVLPGGIVRFETRDGSQSFWVGILECGSELGLGIWSYYPSAHEPPEYLLTFECK